jgi:hypothetical protein
MRTGPDEMVYDPRTEPAVTVDGPQPRDQLVPRRSVPSRTRSRTRTIPRDDRAEAVLSRQRVDELTAEVAVLQHAIAKILQRVFPSGIPLDNDER